MHHYAKSYVSSITEIVGYFTIDMIPQKAIKEKSDENDDPSERWHSDFGTAR